MADATTTTTKARGVECRSKTIEADDGEHDLANCLRAGVPAMRREATRYRYMKPNPGEMETVEVGGQKTFTLYQLRIERADLPNPWADTIRSTARLPFRSRIVLNGWDVELMGKQDTDGEGDHVPGWVDDVTGEGESLDEYAAAAFEDSLFLGICFSFVDNDPRSFPDPASRRLAGARPKVTKLLRSDFRRITVKPHNGVPRLLQIAFDQPIRETSVSDPNAWVDDDVPAIKVVTAGDPDAANGSDERKVRTSIYLQNERDKTWYEDVSKRAMIVPDDPLDELVDIPLVPHYSHRTGPFRGRSPFLDTAWTQQTIWNHNSEMGSMAREASLAFVHESGVQTDQKTGLPLRSDTRNARYRWSSMENARLTIAEMQGTALTSIMALIEWKTRTIKEAHNQLRSEVPTAPVTAREITLEGVKASSALEMWVIFQEKSWKKILDLIVLLGGLKMRGSATIAHDFGLPNAGMERNHQLFMAGMMSPKNYWNEARRAGDVDERTFDYDYEVRWASKYAAIGGSEEKTNDARTGDVLPPPKPDPNAAPPEEGDAGDGSTGT